MLGVVNETLINVREIAGLLPPGRKGKRLNYSTIWRWVTKGVTSPAGKVRLETVKVGGRVCTSLEALERFVAAQNPRHAEAAVPPPRSATTRRRATERARQELEAAGI